MNLIYKLKNLYRLLNQNNLDIYKIYNEINNLKFYKDTYDYNYLEDLLNPFKRKNVKIPSYTPVPSCTFQLRNSFTIETNNKGCFLLIINPYFLTNGKRLGNTYTDLTGGTNFVSGFTSTCWINNTDNLDGKTIGNFYDFTSLNIGQTIPDIYTSYRLVTAGIKIKYIGALDEACGIIGGSITYDSLNTVAGEHYYRSSSDQQYDPSHEGVSSATQELTKYCDFSYFKNKNTIEKTILNELELLYYPLDNSFNEYIKVFDGFSNLNIKNESRAIPKPGGGGVVVKQFPFYNLPEPFLRTGFNWVIYGENSPILKECFNIEIACNFECLPNPDVTNYIPVSVYQYGMSDIERYNLIEKFKNIYFNK